MGSFHEHELKKSSEKGASRSRIPRLVALPVRPETRPKGPPHTEATLSEGESKGCNTSIEHSKRTISPNSFSSDDTGCPSSQSGSPAKTPPGSDSSPLASPTTAERKAKAKRVRMNVMEERSVPRQRQRREQQRPPPARGSEAELSSSSSSGSIKPRQSITSTGRRTLSHRPTLPSHGVPNRGSPVFKPAGIPAPPRDSVLYAPYQTPTNAPLSPSIGPPSPSTRRSRGRYHSCGDNHGIRPPNPEQYLTPLQQKEVFVRHLKTKLYESENRVHDREAEVEELKAQLGRMREDWIEEECHRVEAQLSLKEARKEIKQLRQVVETMKNSLMEKDKGIQKYFIDINIQNRKLESLLHSMEVAQSGCSLQDEATLDFLCDSLEKVVSSQPGAQQECEQGAEQMADSALLVDDEMANRTDIVEQVLMSTAVEASQDSGSGPKVQPQSGLLALEHSAVEMVPAGGPGLTVTQCEERGVQTDDPPCSPEIQDLLLQLLKLQSTFASGPANPSISTSSISSITPLSKSPAPQDPITAEQDELDIPPPSPSAVSLTTPETLSDSGLCCSETEVEVGAEVAVEVEVEAAPELMEELAFDGKEETSLVSSPGMAVVGKTYWSNNILVDLVAVAAPVLPTMAWLYSRHGVDGGAPVYNIGTLIRGCCIMGLHSLRQVSPGSEV